MLRQVQVVLILYHAASMVPENVLIYCGSSCQIFRHSVQCPKNLWYISYIYGVNISDHSIEQFIF